MNLLTPDRFLAAWNVTGLDEFPFPLRYRSTALWEDEHAANLHAADDWLRRTDDPTLERAIRTLATGEIAIEVHGRSENPAAEVFARGAIAGEHAVLARQAPDYGDITLQTTTANLLAGAIVDGLPPVAAGRDPELVAPIQEVTVLSDTGAVRRPQSDTRAEALRRLLLRERSTTGSIRVLTRTERGFTPVADIGWFDVVGDGRYLFVPGPDIRATPAGPAVLRTELSALVHRARDTGRPGGEGVLRRS